MKSNLKSAVVLTVKNAPNMTRSGRKKIAKWLIQQAEFLLNYADDLAPTFRARYLYKE